MYTLIFAEYIIMKKFLTESLDAPRPETADDDVCLGML